MIIVNGSLDFGNVPASSITGKKVTDPPATESATTTPVWAASPSTCTPVQLPPWHSHRHHDHCDPTGTFAFTGLAPGTYFVQEVVPASYTPTTATGQVVIIGAGGTQVGDAATVGTFANFQNGRITGTKVTDITGDGFTGDDTGLSGVAINLYQGTAANGEPYRVTTTDANGNYFVREPRREITLSRKSVPAGSEPTLGGEGYVVTVGGEDGLPSGGTSTQ